MAGAIAQHRRNCESLFVLMKNPLFYRAAPPESGGKDAKGSLLRCSLELGASDAVSLRRQAVLITHMEIESTSWGTRRSAGR